VGPGLGVASEPGDPPLLSSRDVAKFYAGQIRAKDVQLARMKGVENPHPGTIRALVPVRGRKNSLVAFTTELALIQVVKTQSRRQTIMDSLHREPQPKETRTGRDCEFCRHFDPEFRKRQPMDRLVCSELKDTLGFVLFAKVYSGLISVRDHGTQLLCSRARL
jgi:hypothetical protein